MPRVTAVPGEDTLETRDLILREAERLFASKGYGGVSIRDLARGCGVTNAALYYHFENKEAIFLETVRSALGVLRQAVEQAAKEGGGLRDTLSRISRAYLRVLSHKRSLIQLMLLETGGLGKRISDLINQYHREIPGVVAGAMDRATREVGLRKADPHLVAVTLLWTLNGFVIRQIAGGEAIKEEGIVSPVLDLLFEGMAGA